MAFGLIENKAAGLDQLLLMPVSGRLDERARHAMKNREAISAWEAHVENCITRPRNAAHSDLNGIIAELARFFSGPEIPTNTEKVALLISDGIHDAQQNRRSQVQLPPDVKVLVVGIDAARAKKLFAGRVYFFSSIEAALESLHTTREE